MKHSTESGRDSVKSPKAGALDRVCRDPVLLTLINRPLPPVAMAGLPAKADNAVAIAKTGTPSALQLLSLCRC